MIKLKYLINISQVTVLLMHLKHRYKSLIVSMKGVHHWLYTEQDVLDVILNINVNKASGPVSISPKIIRKAGASISKSLCKLFNLSLKSG